MPYVEPTIPVIAPAGDDTRLPTPIAGGFGGTYQNRAIKNTYFELPGYIIGTDIPKAVHIPNIAGSRKAVLSIEQNGGTAGAIIARYWLDGTWPTRTTGIPLRDKDKITIECYDDLLNCRIVSTDTNQHIIQVQLFN